MASEKVMRYQAGIQELQDRLRVTEEKDFSRKPTSRIGALMNAMALKKRTKMLKELIRVIDEQKDAEELLEQPNGPSPETFLEAQWRVLRKYGIDRESHA